MTTDLSAAGHTMSLGSAEEVIFRLPEELALPCPGLRRLELAASAGDLTLAPHEAQELAHELDTLRQAYRRRRLDDLRESGRLHARDPSMLDGILDSLLAGDLLDGALRDLGQLCQAAARAGEAVIGLGD